MIILNEVKIKYDHLDKLLEDKMTDIRFGKEVNVIVDLKEVFRKFFRPNISVEEGLAGRNIVEELTSDIINIIGHYRNYFYKKGKYTTFYFLYSKSESGLMKAKNADYRKDYYKKYFSGTTEEEIKKVSITKKVVEVLERIIEHIPNSSFINTSEFDEFTVANFLISQTKGSEMNIVLSHDEMMAQLINKNTFMIDIKGIKSSLLEEKNAISILCEKESTLSSRLLSLLLSISGVEKYNIENIDRIGMIKALKTISKLVETGKVMDTEYVDFPLTKESLSEKDRGENLLLKNFDKIKENYYSIKNSDILHSNKTNLTILFNKPKKVHTLTYYLDLNSKIFNTYPLNLEMILKGELK
jgi:hypothetical protein